MPLEREDQRSWFTKGWDALFGRGEHAIPNLTPEQEKAQQQFLQQLAPLLQQLSSQPAGNFQDIANLEKFKFNTETIPSIAERFNALGAGGQLSSGYKGALGSAASQLHTNLASMGAQYGLQQRGQNLDLLRTVSSGGMAPAYSYMGGQPGLIQQAIPAAAILGGAYLMGPAGAMAAHSLFGGGQSSGGGQSYAGANQWQQQLASLQGTNPNTFFANSGIIRG